MLLILVFNVKPYFQGPTFKLDKYDKKNTCYYCKTENCLFFLDTMPRKTRIHCVVICNFISCILLTLRRQQQEKVLPQWRPGHRI